MNKGIKNLFVISISICVVLTLLLTGCGQVPAQPEQSAPPAAATPAVPSTPGQKPVPEPTPPAVPPLPSGPMPPPPSAPSLPMKAQLSVSEPPVLGKPVQLTATLTIIEGGGIEEANNTSVEIILPEGFELVSGSLRSTLDARRGAPAQLQAVVKSVKTGIWAIEVRAYYSYPVFVGGRGVANAYLYASVSEDSAKVSDVPIRPDKIPSPKPAPPPPGTEVPTPVPPVTPTGPEPPVQPVLPGQEPSPLSQSTKEGTVTHH